MRCLDEGRLRAYSDGELPEAQFRRTASHLDSCALCRGRLERLEAATARVNAWLDAMDAMGPQDLPALHHIVPQAVVGTGRARWRRAAGALAAGVALFLATARGPRKEAGGRTPQAPLADGVPSAPGPAVATAPLRAATLRKRIGRPKPKPQPALDGFMALGDPDPMQMGIVVRTLVPVSDASTTGGVQEIAADLVIGEDGRARAIRFVR